MPSSRRTRRSWSATSRGRRSAGTSSARALEAAVSRGELFPVACGVATQNLGTTALLDLLVEGIPSPAEKMDEAAPTARPRSSSRPSPTRSPGRITVFRVLAGSLKGDSTLVNSRTTAKERLGQLLVLQGKDHQQATEFVAGDIGAVAKLKETMTGDVLSASDTPAEIDADRVPAARDELRGHAEGEGRRGEGDHRAAPARRGGSDARAAPRRADRGAAPRGHEPDARRGRGRPAQASLRRRGRAAPAARSVSRDDPQGVTRPSSLQEADGWPRASSATATSFSSRSRATRATSSSTRSSAASSRRASGRRSTRGSRRRCEPASSPALRCRASRVRLVDGQYHNVDSSEMAFKIAGSMAFKDAYAKADPGPSRADHVARGDGSGRRPSAPSTAISTPAADVCSAWSRSAG